MNWHSMHITIRTYLTAWLILSGFSLRADWPTFGHDPQRSGWAEEESKITPQSARNLQLKWSVHLDSESLALSALTAPVIARNVVTTSGLKTLVYVAGAANKIFAVDAADGTVAWSKTLQSYVNAKAEPFYLCPNSVNATPVVDSQAGVIYSLAFDGRLWGLDLGTGSVKFGPFQFVPPFAKPWSLNLKDGYFYTTTSQNCGGDRSGLYAMQVSNPLRRSVYETLVRTGSGGGMWARGGTAIGDNGKIYVSTGDGAFNPSAGEYGSTYLAASTPQLEICDYFSPLNWVEVNKRDLDFPSGGHLLFSYRDYHLLVGGGKESVVYLMDADHLGNKDHRTPLYVTSQLGNEGKALEEKGLWGAPALWKDETGQPWIYVTLWGAPSKQALAAAASNGPAEHGSVVALRVETSPSGQPKLKVAWISPDVNLPDAPAVANGVVFVVATGENPRQDKMLGKTDFKSEKEWKDNLLTTEERGAGTNPAVLTALDAKTGKPLFNSGSAMKTWNHFGGLAINEGQIYAVDHGANLYCFGLPAH